MTGWGSGTAGAAGAAEVGSGAARVCAGGLAGATVGSTADADVTGGEVMSGETTAAGFAPAAGAIVPVAGPAAPATDHRNSKAAVLS